MLIFNKKSNSRQRTVKGGGFLNNIINRLPFELHLPGYQYCGPGTNLSKRIKRGDPGVNPLDAACKLHDIAYEKHKDLKQRHIADKQLAEQAWQRVKAKDSSLSEKASAWLVTNAMKSKIKLGMGIVKKRKNTKAKKTGKNLFNYAVRKAKAELKQRKMKNLKDAINISQSIARHIFKGKRAPNSVIPRIIPLPKTGGFLPLAPIMAAIGALGGLGGLVSGASSIAKTIHDIKNARDHLAEAKRHNRALESVSIGKGLYLRPYKKGYGLYKHMYPKNF